MIANIFNNHKVQIAVGAVVVAVGIWAKTSAIAMPIFPIIGIIFGTLLMYYGFSRLEGIERCKITTDIRLYIFLILLILS
ncbi:MAG: hypothetical protein HZB76_01055 [Chlamydiae bacterium]|nr:hypothetical protein [Chlamydiota bacterium]